MLLVDWLKRGQLSRVDGRLCINTVRSCLNRLPDDENKTNLLRRCDELAKENEYFLCQIEAVLNIPSEDLKIHHLSSHRNMVALFSPSLVVHLLAEMCSHISFTHGQALYRIDEEISDELEGVKQDNADLHAKIDFLVRELEESKKQVADLRKDVDQLRNVGT